jgi:predicted phage terminase large subunit-like protein
MYNFLTLDPAWSRGKRAHWAAMTVVGVDLENNWYIREIWRNHGSEAEIVNEYCRLARKYSCQRTGLEVVFYQLSFKMAIEEQMRKDNYFFRIEALQANAANKDIRIRALVPRWEQGTIFIPRHDPNHKVLVDEILQYPRSQTDDILDSLAYQLQLAFPPAKDEFMGDDEGLQMLSVTDEETGYVQSADVDPMGLAEILGGSTMEDWEG